MPTWLPNASLYLFANEKFNCGREGEGISLCEQQSLKILSWLDKWGEALEGNSISTEPMEIKQHIF